MKPLKPSAPIFIITKKLEKEGNLKKHIPKNRKGANVMENVESGCQRKNYNFCIIGNI